MALLLPDVRGRRSPRYHLLAGVCQGATACPGGGAPPIRTVVPGEWLQPASRSPPVQRSGIGCAAAASLLMNSQCHPSEEQQGSKCFLRRRQLREHRVFHGLPETTDAGNAIVTERGHTTRSQPELRAPCRLFASVRRSGLGAARAQIRQFGMVRRLCLAGDAQFMRSGRVAFVIVALRGARRAGLRPRPRADRPGRFRPGCC
jgi:hypothetical protein